jgi:large subunit ribosomal protein L19
MDINFRVGDTVAVHQKIKEGDPSAGSGQEKTRIQVFEGVVLAINKTAKSFTVRKVSDGVGVERIWSFNSPWIEKIEIKKKAKKIRRAKLYYLRRLTPKEVGRRVS